MSIQDPIQGSVETVPVAASVATRPGRSRGRWLVAAAVTVVVVAVAVVATLLMTGAAGQPDVLAWAPTDSVVYVEVRLDLPGDQAAALAKTMSAVPGFADQAAFPTKLGEALDQLVKKATTDKQSYLADIAPWFGGQLSVSMGPLPATADARAARGLVLASVKDGAKAAAWATAALTAAGVTTTAETYNGVTITTFAPPAAATSKMAGATVAWASLGPVIALGDPASVRAAIDTGGKKGLATNAQFTAAAATITGDRLVFAYVDVAGVTAGAKALAGTAAASAMPSLPAMVTNLAAPWVAVAIRAQDGGLVVQTRMPHVAILGTGASGDARLPAALPAGTVALVEGRSVGETLERLKAAAAADPGLAPTVKQLDTTIGIIGGGFGGIVDWMGEAGVAVVRTGTSATAGLVISPTDRAGPDRLLAQLRAVIALAGGAAGANALTDTPYAGSTITTIDVSSLGPLLSGLASGVLGGGTGGTSGGSLPSIPANLKLSYAVTDKVVVLSPDVAFVKAVLDAGTGGTLAASDRFKAASASAGSAGGAFLWLDAAGARDLVASMVPSADRTTYTADFKPYLDSLDSIIGTFSPGASIDSGTLDIQLRKP
jgi:hypothetical protein